jgi:hypothetical protein
VHDALSEADAAAETLPPGAEGQLVAIELLLQEAATALLEHDADAARRAAWQALSIDPNLTPDARRYPPPVVKLVEKAKVTRARAPAGGLRILSTPEGSTVWVAGVARGTTPMELTGVASGPIALWVVGDGQSPRFVKAEAAPDGPALAVTLRPLDPTLRLQPLVEAIRREGGEGRQSAALSLAATLEVDDVIVLDDPTAEPTVFSHRPPRLPVALVPVPAPAPALPPVAPPPVEVERPWYARPWVWGVGAGVVAAGVATAVVISVNSGGPARVSCCR